MSSKIKFKVVYASSREPGCDEKQLEVHQRDNKGWQSARFCDYPQELILELKETSTVKQLQILSHQSKISRRVELYVASGVNKTVWRDADFKRLGYLSLDKNERSNFRARELKSVYIDTRARYVKLLLHESHINAINLFNQVGIVALNVLGDIVKAGAPDDMAFDLEYDSRTAQEIREMESAKRRAVAEEDYDEAKRLKQQIEHLKQVGAEIQELEQQKKIAVHNEDYDQAKQLKMQIENLRLNRAQLPSEHTPEGDNSMPMHRNNAMRGYSPQRSPVQHTQANPQSHSASHSQSHDIARMKSIPAPPCISASPMERGPVANSPPARRGGPPVQNSPPNQPNFTQVHDDSRHQQHAPPPAPVIRPDDLPIRPMASDQDPAGVANPFGQADPGEPGDSSGLPRPAPLNGAQLKDAQNIIEIFGEYAAQCVYSKIWNLRDEGLKKIGEWWQESESKSAPEKLAAFRETLGECVLRRVLKDRVTTVFLSGTNLLSDILEKHIAEFPRPDVMSKLHDLLGILVSKLGTTNPRVLEAVGTLLVNLAHHDKVGPRSVCVALLKPPVLSGPKMTKPLEMRARGQIILELLPYFKLQQNAGLTLHAIMQLVVPQIEHKDDDVRKVGIQIAAICYQLAGRKVVPYVNNMKDAMRESLNIAFEDSTGEQCVLERDPKSLKEQKRPSRSMVNPPPPQRRRGTKSGQRKSNRKPKPAAAAKDSMGSPKRTLSPKLRSPSRKKSADGAAEEGPFQEELGFCQFCGAKDDKFFEEENLDLHYWQDCPMLTSCLICEQVIEISTLYDHLCDECEMVTDTTLDQYYADLVKNFEQKPPPPPEKGNRCPLCFVDIAAGDEGWQHHLLEDGGCDRNKRSSSEDAEAIA